MQKQLFTKTRWLVTIMLLTTLAVPHTWATSARISAYGSITSGRTYWMGASTGNPATDYYWQASGGIATSNSNLSGVAVTSASSGTVVKFTGSGTSWTIQFLNGNYLTIPSTDANGKYKSQTASATWTLSNVSSLIKMTINSHVFQKNNSATAFGSYKTTSNQKNIWLEPALKVKYVGNSNTRGTAPDSAFYLTSTTVTVASNTGALEKTGYTFGGWNTQADGNGTNYTAGSGKFTITSDITLYAKWVAAGTSVSLTKAASSNGSFTLSPASSVTTTSGAQNVTVSCTPNTGYYVSNVTATNPATGTATVTGSGNSWNVQYSSGANGTSTISVTFSPGSTWKFKYSGDGYTAHTMTEAAGVASYSLDLAADTRYEFGFDDNGIAFYKNQGTIITTTSGWVFNTSDNNCKIHTGPAGTYTFAINTTTKAVTVTYPDVTHPNEHYVYFKNSDVWGTVKGYLGNSGNDNKAAAWPGSDMQATASICGETYHYAALNAMNGTYNTIIFNNGISGYGNQTSDLSTTGSLGKYNANRDANWHDFTTYTITYAGGGGTGGPMASNTGICPGSSQQLTANTFTKSGYTFSGWTANVDVKIGGSTITAGTLIANTVTIQDIQGNITLTAQWTPNPHTLTWSWGSGSTSSTTYTGYPNLSSTVDYGTAISYPAQNTMSRTGYNFNGWSSSPSTMPDDNLTITAQWQAKTTTVTLNNQSATTTGATSVTATYGQAMPSIASNKPEKTGYDFGGYYTQTGGGGTMYYKADGTSNKNWDFEDATKTLYAKWTNHDYTIAKTLTNCTSDPTIPTSYTYTGSAANLTYTFAANSGYELPASVTVSGVTYTWDQSTGVLRLTGTISANVSITVVALPKVSWIAGGTEIHSQTGAVGTALTDPGTPSPATYCPGGKVFVGWSANTIAGTSNTQPTDLFTDATKKKIPAGGITYYAVYATSTGSSSTSYAAITSGLASGNYVIAYEYSNNGTRIALQNIADNSDASNKMEAYALARDGSGKYANPSDTYIWQLQAQDGGGYYIYDLATGMYLNATTSALQLSTTPTKYNIAYDGTNSRWKIQLNSSSSYYVHGYTGTYTDFRVSTSGSGVNYRVYLYKNEGTQTFSAYATTCCENIIALTAGATDATTHCTSVTFSNDNLPTCSDEPTDRRVTITVTPYDGYDAPAELTPSGDGTATYVSGPAGSGPYTYVYEFNQNDDGDGTFTATCTPKEISLVLDKNNSDVSGSANGSATVYFDATSLSTISHATRSGHVLDGYYAEPGCTNKVLTDAGALVNYTGYVVSSKWARATTPTTLYAKWIEKSFDDYKFSCADLSLTDEEVGTPKTPIWITTSAGQIVRSQKALHIEGTGLKPSSTFTFTIGGVDANDCSGTGEHDLFAIRQANYSAVATDASGNIDMDVYVFYNPTGATDGLDQPGSTIVATSASGTVAGKEYMSLSVTLSTTSVNGRHLPNQFVMAARIGKTWYALPGNITTNATQDPVMIGVDNATNPTIAYCPAAYGFRIVSLASTQANPNGNTANNAVDSRGFYTDGEKIKLRLQNDAPMFGSTGTSIGKSDATNWWGGGKNYFWTLEHQNTAASNINAVTYNIRTANTNSNPLIRLNRGQWKWGLYANGVEEIRLLSITPVQDLTLEVMEWGTNEIAVQYSGSGSLTNVKIGDSEEGATMSTICGDIKRISGLSSLVAGASGKQGQQMLIQITESEVLKQKIVQVPFIVNSTDVTTDNLRTWTGGATTAEQDSITYNMEIVVRPGAKITTNNGYGKFGKLSIYPGGMADISNAIRLAHFTMRGGYSWLGGAFAMPHAKVTGNVTGTGNQVVYDYYIDATKYYDLAVPKTMTWLPVTDETGNEDFTFWVKWYNGATRASTGKGWTWYDWSGEASSWSINMGQGYLVAAQPPAERNYFIMRFPMSITLASDESTKAPIAVTAHGMTAGSLNPGISANNAGWNLIANPFLTSYKKDADGVDGGGDAISGSIAIGELVPEIKEGNPTGKYVWDATGAKNIRYVTTYDYATATYEQHPMSSTVLEPFTGFFIQVAKDCYVRFDASGRQNNIIRRRVESLPDDMEIGITASSDEESDETILLLCDDLSRDNALEFPDESSKLINTGHLNFYTFASATSMYANGMSYAEGQEWNAAGITPTKSGVYSFTVTKVNTSYVEGVLLKDLVSNIEYDLLKDNVDIHLDPGTIDDRFLVKIVLKNEEETPTALDEITEGSINQRPEKIIYNDKLYIRYNGVLYDATGKRVREVNK